MKGEVETQPNGLVNQVMEKNNMLNPLKFTVPNVFLVRYNQMWIELDIT